MRRIHALLLCALGALLYANSVDVPFVFDDIPNIAANERIHLEELGVRPLLDASFGNRSPRPVAHASLALNHWLGGLDVAGYHLVNIAVHCANGVLVYWIALILFRRQLALAPGIPVRLAPAMALLAGAVFVAHPLQTQAVTYVVQRMTSLAALFSLLALLLFLEGRLSEAPRRRCGCFAGAVLAWLLALGSKQVAVMLPLVVWLTEWFFFRDLSRAWLRRGVVWLLAGVALSAVVAFVYLGSSPLAVIVDGYEERDFTLVERVLTQPRVLVLYLSQVVLPLPGRLSLVHTLPTSRSLLDPPTTLAAGLLLAGLLALAAGLARRQRVVAFSILWFFAWHLLESSVVPLEMVYEHRNYLPMVGVSLLAPWLLFSLPLRPPLRIGVAVALVALLAAGTVLRNERWRDPVVFWSDVVAKNPERRRAHDNLANAYVGRGDGEAAVRHFREALRLDPDADVHSNLGVVFGHLGRFEEAGRHHREALRLDPGNSRLHNNYGALLVQQGRRDEAVTSFREALRLDPANDGARENLERFGSQPRVPSSSSSRTRRAASSRGSRRNASARWRRAGSGRPSFT